MHNIRFLKTYNNDYPYWHHVEQNESPSHFIHDLLVYGDYCSTDVVEKSNVKSVIDNEAMCERLNITELHEGYNTVSVLFPIAALQDAEVLELIDRLESYPLLDDDLHSMMLVEAESEAWEHYGIKEFRQALQCYDYDVYDTDESILLELYYELSVHCGCGLWEDDSSGGYYRFEDLKRIPKDLLEKTLNNYLKSKEEN